MKALNIFTLGLIIFALASCQNKKAGRTYTTTTAMTEEPKKKLDLKGTSWASKSMHGLEGDSLIFETNKKVRLFLGELNWDFDSEYVVSNDTLTVKSILATFEMNDVNGLEPDLIEKFVITKDSLFLFYLANKRNNKWEKANSDRLKMIQNYHKIK
jgi:hypothetical protein